MLTAVDRCNWPFNHAGSALHSTAQEDPCYSTAAILKPCAFYSLHSEADEEHTCPDCSTCQCDICRRSLSPPASAEDELPMAFVPQRIQRGAGRVLRPRQGRGPPSCTFEDPKSSAVGGRREYADFYGDWQRHIRPKKLTKKRRATKKRKAESGDTDLLPPPIWPIDQRHSDASPLSLIQTNVDKLR